MAELKSPDPLGKRALFWAPAERDDDMPRPGAATEIPGKHALFSVAATEATSPTARQVMRQGPVASGLLPPVTVQCSSCGATTDVDVVGYLTLHLPFFLWRPGRGFTRFMTCPTCRHRAWLSASWTPWSNR
ncbi:MAG: hypothetical protein ACYDA2_10350 [Acidimicrobiales bacterium]